MAGEGQLWHEGGNKGNIVDYLFEKSLEYANGHRPYLKSHDETWSFRRLADRTNQVGNLLKSLGVLPGDRVLFSVVDGIDFPALFLGSMKIGAIAVPISTYLKSSDYRYYINDSGAKIVVADHTLEPIMAGILGKLTNVAHVWVTRAPGREFPFFDEAIESQSAVCDSFACHPNDMAFWLYSSGSTGDPKGVVHTGPHLYWATELFGIGTQGISKDDVILCPPKMYFAFGLGNQVYFPIRTGAQVLVNPDMITPEKIWEQWLEYEPTIVVSVPTLYASMLRIAETRLGRDRVRKACHRLRFCVSGGEVLPPSLVERWQEFAGVEILDGVGTTELTHMFILNRPGNIVPRSSGQLVRGYRAELLDDDGKVVPPGEIGNLHVYGPTAAEQYWNKPDATARVMKNGGVMTGDKFSQDQEGNFYFVGRADDMLRVGGVWVSPAEVESVIAQHESVLECAVVGHPDSNNMIKPKAYVVLRSQDPTNSRDLELKLRDHVRERLAHIKCPRWFEFVSELPKTSTGKLQRFRLREGSAGAPPAFHGSSANYNSRNE